MKRVCYRSLVTLAASFLCQNVCCTKGATVKVSATVEPMMGISFDNSSSNKNIVFNKENTSHTIKYNVTHNLRKAKVKIKSTKTPNASFSSSADTECKLVHSKDPDMSLAYKVKNEYNGQKDGTLSLKMDDWGAATTSKTSGEYADTITLEIESDECSFKSLPGGSNE